MKSITEHIRDHLLESAGLAQQQPMPDLKKMQETEWSPRFEKYMRNRLIMGAFRYGLLHAPGKPSYDIAKAIVGRIERYAKTGNTELLVDVANLALLEFEEGHHPKRHFHSDDGVVHVREIGA